MIAELLAVAAAALAAPSAQTAYDVAHELAAAGPRPAGSAAERRAHALVARRFEAAGLEVRRRRFRVPGHGGSRNVVGMRDGRRDCLKLVLAHADSVPPAPGAIDNASGVGALVALAEALPPQPRCDAWLVATGAEERPYTGQPDHLGAAALVRRIERRGRARDVRFALSLDEVGRGRAFWLRSPAAAPRPRAEALLLRAARRAGVDVRWVRDAGTGNSDHREFELAGLRGMKLGVTDEPCRHTACDVPSHLERGAFRRVLRVVAPLID